jgi:organic radical activating enzyme
MLYDFKNDKIVTKAVEYSVSYHCNLRCAGCSHISPFIDRQFPSLESFSADIDKLCRVLHVFEFRLLGGEPLLNPDIDSFIGIMKQSGIADKVTVTTNGLLLHTMTDHFWENVDSVIVTLYPDTVKRVEKYLERIMNHAKQSNTELCLWKKPIFRTTMLTKGQPKDWITDMIFKTCKNVHFGHCHMIHEGKLYKCAVPPFLPQYLSKIGMDYYNPAEDAFDIHKSTYLLQDLKAFLTSFKTLKACKFCLGYLGKSQNHHQLESEFISHPELQRIARETHLDYRKLTIECFRYYLRRLTEKVTEKNMW